MAQTHRQTDRQTHRHGDSMTNSAQWGRVGENSTSGADLQYCSCAVQECAGCAYAPYITGFQFMANKQFRMEKRLGTSVCADISKYALKNQYVQFLYEKTTQHIFFLMKFLVFCRFLNQIRLQKTVFWTNME